MNTKQTEALKLALEALIAAFQGKDNTGQVPDAITAICEALAHAPEVREQPAQRTWVGLTQEDMYEIGEFKNTHGYVPTGFKRLVAAIEANLKEKNGF